MKIRHVFAAVAISAAGLAASTASAATYLIDWTGSGGYTMTGLLEFDDGLMGTGLIDENDISELSIDVMLNSVSIGTRSLTVDGYGSHEATFNLNFDTTAGEFVVGGFSLGSTGQNWFASSGGGSCDTIGFSSGSVRQGICSGFWVSASSIPSSRPTLNATLAPSVVPLPAGGLMLLSALGIGGFVARRRKQA